MYVLDKLLYREEMTWLQQLRITWLKEVDRNMQYFHRKAVWRARKNLIRRLRQSDGTWCMAPTEMELMAKSYFQEHFTKDPTLSPAAVLGCIEPKVTQHMNERLDASFTEKEVADVLFQIGPIKAPGPDGFPAWFFQKNWSLLKEEITATVLEFHVSGIMPPGVNDTAIVLIPKVPSPVDLKDFCPISLCNVIYKVVSKCLVNRLRPLLVELISENQSAFIPGRLISDNTVIAFECIHHIQSSLQEQSYCAYKLDLSKAYDRVDWDFWESALLKWGFSVSWVNRIMVCVRSIKYAVKFNGKMLDQFTP